MSTNKEVIKEWVAALRSGDYTQGRGALHRRRTGIPDEFCCLGVLCELAVKHGVIPPPSLSWGEGDKYVYDMNALLPTDVVMAWVGVEDWEIGRFLLPEENDFGATFAIIANRIEAAWG